MWKDYLPEKDMNVVRMYMTYPPLVKFAGWVNIQNTLDSILPCDDFKDKDEGRFILVAWWEEARKLGLLTSQEHQMLIRVGIDDLYF